LPDKTTNKDRLNGDELPQQLTEAVMGSIESKWNLLGAEEMVGPSLADLRTKYQITAIEINPFHQVEYGTATYKGEPEELNLHVTLRRKSFPPNVADAVVLRVLNGNVEGVQKFLDNGSKYEDLFFSVPWLTDFIHNHPRIYFRISYAQNASLGSKAMRTFVADMKLRGRDDLIKGVQAEQNRITLLIVGMTYYESYWLVFPDKHMLLWRYDGPSGLLKWAPADFGQGKCADGYEANGGGCSGREISPDGTLIPDVQPRDAICTAARLRTHPPTMLPPSSLFP
jgi:hypothetical protein